MSVARNSHLTNKPEANGVLILLPPLSSPSVLRFKGIYSYLKLHGHQERSWKKDLAEVTPGNQIRDLPHRRPHTNQLS